MQLLIKAGSWTPRYDALGKNNFLQLVISTLGKTNHTTGHIRSDQKLFETSILFPKKMTGRCVGEKEHRASIYEVFPDILLASSLFNLRLLLGKKPNPPTKRLYSEHRI